ncbi:MAG: PIN domain-containing protein [Nitrospirae bacterium]|nr:PIN domain-containing protein [Nitrospirota bacterium]
MLYVRDGTIGLRRRAGLKLPDAVIAATALQWGAVLLTNDSRMADIHGLKTQTLVLRSTEAANGRQPKFRG